MFSSYLYFEILPFDELGKKNYFACVAYCLNHYICRGFCDVVKSIYNGQIFKTLDLFVAHFITSYKS